jgi:NAD(P)-dependent dehydrogenase (short-subunit alcohol dehydrogenase family)
MTKHAMEAYGDALADEMKRFGVKVSLIEPGTYLPDKNR